MSSPPVVPGTAAQLCMFIDARIWTAEGPFEHVVDVIYKDDAVMVVSQLPDGRGSDTFVLTPNAMGFIRSSRLEAL